MRRALPLLIAVVFLVLVSIAALFYATRPPKRSISFSLSPHTVHPGGSLALVSVHRNAIISAVSPSGNIAINDATGSNLTLRARDIVAKAGLDPDRLSIQSSREMNAHTRVNDVLDKTPGFIRPDAYNYLRAQNDYSNTGLSLADGIYLTCPVGELPNKPPKRLEVPEEWIVLPSTPAGTYKVVVPANRYCRKIEKYTVDNTEATLSLSVLPEGD